MKLLRDIAHRLDRARWAEGMFGVALDDWQKDFLRSDHPRKIACASRQSGKSFCVALLAAHTATFRPGTTTVVLNPTIRQSQELFRRIRGLLHDLPEDRRPGLVEESKTMLALGNGARVVVLPSSEHLRGLAVDLLLLDECARIDDSAIDASRPMVAASGGSIVMASTPAGTRGRFFEAWTQHAAEWSRFRVTADRCPRISAAFLAEERRVLGERAFRAEYGCEFTGDDEQLFDHDLVQSLVSDDVEPLDLRRPLGPLPTEGDFAGLLNAQGGQA